MSASAPWKDTERRHAKRMTGARIWRQDFSEEKPDGESATDTWDAKTYKRFSIVSMFKECEKKYRLYSAGRRFHLVLHEPGKPGDFVVCRADDYAALVRSETLAKEAGLL